MSKQLCPECGKPLPINSPDGTCPACLLSLGLVAALAREPSASLPSSAAPGDRIGRYKLLEPIGEGGFGDVWMAEQQEPVRRKVALKIIKLGMDTRQVVGRFEAERQALAMMDHPNIARVFDGGATDTGRPYFVMELVQGIPITTYCDTRKLTTRERLELLIQVCQAVQHAHQKGIIHRDLKPSNILVTEQDGQPMPKVIDFGIAKATGAELTEKTLFTQFNQMIGTPAYMSPEQAGLGSLDVDTRTDIYSLGVLLYELLTGQTPFDIRQLLVAGLDEIRRTIREQEPTRPSTRLTRERMLSKSEFRNANREIDPDLDWIALKALEKDRSRRYQTASGLAQELRSYLDHDLVEARPPSAVYRLKKLVRRNQGFFGAAATVVVVSLVGLTASLWQAKRANLVAAAARRELYIAQIGLAEQAWRGGNLKQAEKFIQAAIPARGQEDPRDFEWRYLRKLCRDESHFTFVDSDFGVPGPGAESGRGVSHPFGLTDDGRAFIVACGNTIRWLDSQSGRETRRISFGTNPITRMAVAMHRAGLLACQTNDRITILSSEGRPLPVELPVRQEKYAFALSWDGGLLASAGRSNMLRILNVKTGMQVGQDCQLREGVSCLAFSPDGRYLVCGTVDTQIQILEVPSLRVLKELSGHTAIVECLAFDPDGRRFASGANDSRIYLWSFPEGRELARLNGHQGFIGDLAFSPNGRQLASGGADHTLRLWNLDSLGEATFLRGHVGTVRSVRYSSNGGQLYTRSDDRTVKVWQVPTESSNTLRHSQWVSHVTFSPDGTLLATEDYHAAMTVLWDLPSRQRITNVVQHSNRFFNGKVEFSPDGKLLATAGEDAVVQVWNVSERKLVFAFPKKLGRTSLAFHPSQPVLAVARDDMHFWSLRDGIQTNLLTEPPVRPVRSVAFSPDGFWIAVGLQGGSVCLWNLATRHPWHRFQEYSVSANNLCFSHDNALLASGHGEGRVILYDVRQRRLLAHLDDHNSWISGLAFSPDDKSLVSTSWDGTIKFWHVANGQRGLTLIHDGGAVSSVSFSPDGNLMATTGADGVVRLWPAVSREEMRAAEPGPAVR